MHSSGRRRSRAGPVFRGQTAGPRASSRAAPRWPRWPRPSPACPLSPRSPALHRRRVLVVSVWGLQPSYSVLWLLVGDLIVGERLRDRGGAR